MQMDPAGYVDGLAAYQEVVSSGLQAWYQGWGNLIYTAAGGYRANGSSQLANGAAEGAHDGLYSWVNGATLGFNPIPQSAFYDAFDPTLQVSQTLGAVSRDAWLAAAIPNLSVWAKNPLAYEAGSMTLTDEEFAQLSGDAIARGYQRLATATVEYPDKTAGLVRPAESYEPSNGGAVKRGRSHAVDFLHSFARSNPAGLRKTRI